MEELAKKLAGHINDICAAFHYYKDENVLDKSKELARPISQFCNYFLQGNIFGMEEQEYLDFHQYVLQVLEDYIGALEQRDMVYMLDTLDYGLRELLNIYIETEGVADGE